MLMATATSNYCDIVSQLSDGQVAIFHDVTWDEYEELLEQVGEARGLRISFNDGTLKVMSLSPTHEKYADFIKVLVAQIRFRLRINILFFGSATMRKRRESKGNEPDACFYVQTAAIIGNRIELDFAVDPPPDVDPPVLAVPPLPPPPQPDSSSANAINAPLDRRTIAISPQG